MYRTETGGWAPETYGVSAFDSAEFIDWTDTALYAMSALRGGHWHLDGSAHQRTLADIDLTLRGLTHLADRIGGLRDAVLRAHYQAGGSHGDAASAMDVPRATAQSRADALHRTSPSGWERWATGEAHPETRPAHEVRPGWTLVVVGGDRVQVSRVEHYLGGRVVIESGTTTWTQGAATEVEVVPRDVPVTTTHGVRTHGDGSQVEVTTFERADR